LARHNPKSKKVPEKPETPDKSDVTDTKVPPPIEPLPSDQEKSYTRRKLDNLFWFRVGLAVCYFHL